MSVYLQHLTASHRLVNTHELGSNIFASMKHCVAIGGAGCAIIGAGCPTGFKFKALAAAGGICMPVPVKNVQTKL